MTLRCPVRGFGASSLVLLAAVICCPAVGGAQTVSSIQSLSFGAFVVAGAGSLTVHTNGGRSSTGSVYAVSQGGVASAARFNVTGTPYASYAISLPQDSDVVLSDGQGHTMALTQFSSDPSGAGVLAGDGSAQLHLGARLQVGQGQATGSYSGTFNLTVNYQ